MLSIKCFLVPLSLRLLHDHALNPKLIRCERIELYTSTMAHACHGCSVLQRSASIVQQIFLYKIRVGDEVNDIGYRV